VPDDDKTKQNLETLRKLAVDLGKDGHFELGAKAAGLHDVIQEMNTPKPD
jgi:hypothetical protein